jgi:photosystem II oxygen-evolving enhancer protein 2
VKALAALTHLAARLQQGVSEGLDLLRGLAQQVKRQPLSRAGTDAGKTLELVDQPRQRSGESAQDLGASETNLGGLPSQASAIDNACSRVAARPMPFPSLRSFGQRLRQGSLGALLVLVLAISLVGCSAAAAGLNSYASPDGRYVFLYPTGWVRAAVSGGPELVFHDLINSDETLSLVITEVNPDRDLASLGSAVAVGETLRRTAIAPEGSGRQAELIEARERQAGTRTFYDLEYSVHLADRDRHELATVVVDRGRLYTLAASTNEVRWPRVKELFARVVTSFTFQI